MYLGLYDVGDMVPYSTSTEDVGQSVDAEQSPPPCFDVIESVAVASSVVTADNTDIIELLWRTARRTLTATFQTQRLPLSRVGCWYFFVYPLSYRYRLSAASPSPSLRLYFFEDAAAGGAGRQGRPPCPGLPGSLPPGPCRPIPLQASKAVVQRSQYTHAPRAALLKPLPPPAAEPPLPRAAVPRLLLTVCLCRLAGKKSSHGGRRQPRSRLSSERSRSPPAE